MFPSLLYITTQWRRFRIWVARNILRIPNGNQACFVCTQIRLAGWLGDIKK